MTENTSETTSEQSPEKKPWVKPVITPVRSGLANKFGGAGHGHWKDAIDGVPISQLVADHGSPLFVISEKKLRSNMQRIQRVFSARYPDVVFGWSYKTNYLGAVCNILHQEGAWAEVVSEFEYQKARRLGMPGNKIFYNGPHKTRQSLIRAVGEGAHIHVDHLDELHLLEDISKQLQRDIFLTLRLNFDTGYTEPWSRFGFNVESGQAMNAVWRIAATEHLKLNGLHSHIGTFILEPLAYTAQARIMCDFMNVVESKTPFTIEYLDLGGGFASINSLQGIYLPPEQVVPSLEQYADAICTVLMEYGDQRIASGRKRPRLVLETGRAIVDDAEVLISTVIANKRLPDGRKAMIVDAGVNVLFTSFWYNHSVIPTRALDGRAEDTVIYGPLCMNIDVVRASAMLPPLNAGDTLLFTPVGAYNNTQWLQFIEYRPAVVLVHGEQSVSVVREAENLDVVTAQEKLPQHLAAPHLPTTDIKQQH